MVLVITGGIVLLLRSVLDGHAQSKANNAFFESLSLHRESISCLMDIVKAQQAQIDELKKRLDDSPKS